MVESEFKKKKHLEDKAFPGLTSWKLMMGPGGPGGPGGPTRPSPSLPGSP